MIKGSLSLLSMVLIDRVISFGLLYSSCWRSVDVDVWTGLSFMMRQFFDGIKHFVVMPFPPAITQWTDVFDVTRILGECNDVL